MVKMDVAESEILNVAKPLKWVASSDPKQVSPSTPDAVPCFGLHGRLDEDNLAVENVDATLALGRLVKFEVISLPSSRRNT